MTSSALIINNIYGHGYEEDDLQALSRAGFKFRKEQASFAGAQQLNFIDFSICPCLELIKVSDHAAYLDFVPPGMVPYSPGINLGLAEGHRETIQDYQEEFRNWQPYLLHENYEGDLERRQPGWNYLNFTQPPVPDTFIWITEFEQPYPATHPKTIHPNRVSGIQGMLFDLKQADLEGLSALTGIPFQSGVLDLSGVRIYAREAAPLQGALPRKAFPLAGLVLKTADLDYFLDQDPAVEKTSFEGLPACWLRMPDRSWDLLITG